MSAKSIPAPNILGLQYADDFLHPATCKDVTLLLGNPGDHYIDLYAGSASDVAAGLKTSAQHVSYKSHSSNIRLLGKGMTLVFYTTAESDSKK